MGARRGKGQHNLGRGKGAGGLLLNCAWGRALCTVCRRVILIGRILSGRQLRFTSVVSDYPSWVGIVVDSMHLPSGASQLAEALKGLCGPRSSCL